MSCGVTLTKPLPLSGTVMAGVAALVLMVRVPVAAFVVVGAKLTVTVQDAREARKEPQLFVWVKPVLA